MTRADRIIADLMTALDAISRSADRQEPHAYIKGMADYAMEVCNAQRERNADGYLAVTPERDSGKDGE